MIRAHPEIILLDESTCALKLSGNTGRVVNLVFLTPFISLTFIHFVLGKAIEARTWAGLFLILIGIGIQKYQEVKRFDGPFKRMSPDILETALSRKL